MIVAHLDFETKGVVNLIKSGVYRYAADRNTAIWMLSYAFIENGKCILAGQWRPGHPYPQALLDHIASGGRVVAHNAAFERTMWNINLREVHGYPFPEMKIWQMDCTMARASAIAHPQALGELSMVMGLTEQKDMVGTALMQKMCRPRSYASDGRIIWWDDPADVDRLGQYCDQDVKTEIAADEKLPPLSDSERRIWMLDQHINDYGVHVDVAALGRMDELVQFSKKQADAEMRRLTDRNVPKCTTDKKLIEWINGRGIECTTVKKSVQDDLIFFADLKNDDLVKEVINLRKAAKKTSTAKYKAMTECVSDDNRIRGLLSYHGASTGRWAGRLVQPQNFPRVDMDDFGPAVIWLKQLVKDPTLSIKDIYDMIAVVHGPSAPLVLLSKALRSMITAAPGKRLVGGDLSNIEGRFTSWFANETWKLQAFKDYDTIIPGEFDKKGKPKRVGPDLYVLAASGILGKDIQDVTPFERQSVGKVSELALGFQGSVAAFISMGDNYGITPYDISEAVKRAASDDQWLATCEKYHSKGTDKQGLQEKEWVAVKVIVDNWRARHPATVQMWWDVQDAAVEAVAMPGHVISTLAGRIRYYSDNRYLWCILPNERCLCYPHPQIEVVEQIRERADGTSYVAYKRKVTFYSRDGETKRWLKYSLYGGLQCENYVQASARDKLCESMVEASQAGYPIVLTVHDELLTEPDAKRLDLNKEHLRDILVRPSKYYVGLPLEAATWEDVEYVK